MTAEQVIYTSCRRGIDRDSSGFQVFTRSDGLTTLESSGANYQQLIGYQPPTDPRLPSLPTPEEAQSLFPRRYIFSLLGESPYYGLALNTYIGRDYPENSNRPGNFLSHILVLPEADLKVRPYRFVGSPSLISWLNSAKVRSTDRPMPLSTIEPDVVLPPVDLHNFLRTDSHRAIAAELLSYVLSYHDNNDTLIKHPVFIRANVKSFIDLVGIIQELLPKCLASQVSFSTFEWDTQRASTVLVRLLPDQSVNNSYGFEFDCEHGVIRNTSDNTSIWKDFCSSIIDRAVQSEESLNELHKYLDDCNLSQLDQKILIAYKSFLVTRSSYPSHLLNDDDLLTVSHFVAERGTESDKVCIAYMLVQKLEEKGASPEQKNNFNAAIQQFKLNNTDALKSLEERCWNKLITACTDVEGSDYSDIPIYWNTWNSVTSMTSPSVHSLPKSKQMLLVLKAAHGAVSDGALNQVVNFALLNPENNRKIQLDGFFKKVSELADPLLSLDIIKILRTRPQYSMYDISSFVDESVADQSPEIMKRGASLIVDTALSSSPTVDDGITVLHSVQRYGCSDPEAAISLVKIIDNSIKTHDLDMGEVHKIRDFKNTSENVLNYRPLHALLGLCDYDVASMSSLCINDFEKSGLLYALNNTEKTDGGSYFVVSVGQSVGRLSARDFGLNFNSLRSLCNSVSASNFRLFLSSATGAYISEKKSDPISILLWFAFLCEFSGLSSEQIFKEQFKNSRLKVKKVRAGTDISTSKLDTLLHKSHLRLSSSMVLPCWNRVLDELQGQRRSFWSYLFWWRP